MFKTFTELLFSFRFLLCASRRDIPSPIYNEQVREMSQEPIACVASSPILKVLFYNRSQSRNIILLNQSF